MAWLWPANSGACFYVRGKCETTTNVIADRLITGLPQAFGLTLFADHHSNVRKRRTGAFAKKRLAVQSVVGWPIVDDPPKFDLGAGKY